MKYLRYTKVDECVAILKLIHLFAVYPSIYFLQVIQGGAYLSCHGVRGRLRHIHVASLSQD